MFWRFGRIDTSVAAVAPVAGGAAVPGCARLNHHSVSTPPTMTAAAPSTIQRTGDGCDGGGVGADEDAGWCSVELQIVQSHGGRLSSLTVRRLGPNPSLRVLSH